MTEPTSHEDALQAAVDWQLRLREEPRARGEWQAWMAADEAHRVAWASLQRVDLGLRTLAAAPRRWRRSAPLLALAACLLLGVLLLPGLWQGWRADWSTGVGEVREITLADGSRVSLGPQSALVDDFDSGSRRLRLLAGQAFFEVKPDPQRPFEVHTEQGDVRVLGTAFEVDLENAGLDVAVGHGRVQVHAGSQRALLGAGERWHLAEGRAQLGRLPATQVGAWRGGLLYVDDRPLREVLQRLQPYAGGWLLVLDDSLATRRISGVFDLKDSQRALRGLAQSLAVPLHEVGPLRVIGPL